MHKVESFQITCILLFVLFCAVLVLLNSTSCYSLHSHLYVLFFMMVSQTTRLAQVIHAGTSKNMLIDIVTKYE